MPCIRYMLVYALCHMQRRNVVSALLIKNHFVFTLMGCLFPWSQFSGQPWKLSKYKQTGRCPTGQKAVADMLINAHYLQQVLAQIRQHMAASHCVCNARTLLAKSSGA